MPMNLEEKVGDMAVILAKHEERINKLEEWQSKQNGSLLRLEQKVEGIYSWLIGLMGGMIVSLILLVVNMVKGR